MKKKYNDTTDEAVKTIYFDYLYLMRLLRELNIPEEIVPTKIKDKDHLEKSLLELRDNIQLGLDKNGIYEGSFSKGILSGTELFITKDFVDVKNPFNNNKTSLVIIQKNKKQ